MSEYLYTPYEIAIFFMWADLTRSDEVKAKNYIWADGDIQYKYRKNKRLFVKAIDRNLEQLNYDDFFYETQSINKVLSDIGSRFTIENIIDEDTSID